MAEAVVHFIKITAKVSFFGGLALTVFSLLFLIYGNIAVVLNVGVLADLIVLVQQWLPFDISVLLGWSITIIGLIFTFKLAEYAFNMAKNLMS